MKYIYQLRIGIFIAGFCVMVLELLGTRILAPYVGTSLGIWTLLIGIVMAFLSIGYYWGGLVSDRQATVSTVSLLFLGAGIWIFLLAVTKDIFMPYLLLSVHFRYVQSSIATILFLGVPSVLLGAVAPYSARLTIESLNKAGSTVGNLYALSTIGSILGTFLAGFVFIPVFGHLKTLYTVSILLYLASIVLSRQYMVIKILCLCVCVVVLSQGWKLSSATTPRVVDDVDTLYARVQISETYTPAGILRSMNSDGAFSSAAFISNPRILAFDYYHFYDLMFWHANVSDVLMLGGAGMGYPRYVTASYPSVHMTVVEIDPGLYAIAQRSMGYAPSDTISMVFEDGRTYLNTTTKKYDAVLIDAFSSHSIPWHLVTTEAVERIRYTLKDDGLVLMNIISAFEGNRADIVKRIASTYKKNFDYVELFAVQNAAKLSDIQNIILVASDTKLDFSRNNIPVRSKQLLSHYRQIKMNSEFLTDDWSPIDLYTDTLLSQ